ncbi:inhibitor of Bruton tyrosine kinase isoform X2 [Neocloeon triangulifer]|uniref:inhibitor of Bruton tyrosine kinase isoform X2 n=1 Tax=Neocloeon triangulifer TaxID=2078957 RepID=UPI00286F5910|nr:inhibitor of Bruton tyrosine kinase isoform X2 [Neocloeon triangulifer]
MAEGPECSRRCRWQGHAASAIAAVVRGSEEEAVAYLRWLCHRPGQVLDAEGRSALHVAASKGRRRVAEWLVKHKEAQVNLRDLESGYTPLHRSLFYGQVDVAVALIQMGANPLMVDKEDMTPIDLAMKSRPSIVEYTKSGPCEAYVWGTNANFNLGIGNQQSKAVPELVEHFRRGGVNIKQVSMNMYHSVFVSDAGRVFSCGHGQGGRLGQDSEKPSLVPQLMKLTATEICSQVAVGMDHTVLLMENGNVMTCGSNEYHQLGQSGGGPPKQLLSPRCLGMKSLPVHKVLGVCAGRYHTVLWSSKGIATCGLNAGQLGHPKADRQPTVMFPKLIMAPALQFKPDEDNSITQVASSDAALVVALKKGVICLVHEYKCKKIAYRMPGVVKVAVSGGHLDANVEQNNEDLRVCVLNNMGKLFIWQQPDQQMSRCSLQLKRQLIVTDFVLTNQHLLFLTSDCEAFEGFFKQKKKFEGDVECEVVKTKRLPNIHRAVAISCDPRGRNFAVIQGHPKTALLEVPQMESRDMSEQMKTLLDEASEEDSIHDVVFLVGLRRFAAHQCIISARSDILATLIQEQKSADTEDVPEILVLNTSPEIFEQILQFIYTNKCSLLTRGPCNVKIDENISSSKKRTEPKSPSPELNFDPKKVSAFEAYKTQPGTSKKKKNKAPNQKKNYDDPMKIVAAAARAFGLPSLSKALDSYQLKDGLVMIKIGHEPYQPAALSFDRTKMMHLCDATVISLEGDEIQAHRSVLAARLEYFHSMFAHGWAESSRSSVLKMALPTVVLDVLLDFLYSDEAPKVFGDAELARTMLVVADQMFVERLKEACECALVASLTLKNAAELLQLASTYNAAQLKLSCMQYISFNLPVFIESRGLDEVEWEVLEELAKYHREITPDMCRRTITPYSIGPSSDELEFISTHFPIDLDGASLIKSKEGNDFEIKKQKSKPKRNRMRRISSGEFNRNRKDSVGSNASDISVDLEKDVQPLEDELVEEIITLNRVEPVVVEKPVEKPAVVKDGGSAWSNMFPVLETSLSNLDLGGIKPKVSEVKNNIKKLSQKQRKRLSSESGKEPVLPKTPTSPISPWSKHPASPSSSLGDIIKEEKKNAWSKPEKSIKGAVAIPSSSRQTCHPCPSSPQSPPGPAWVFSRSPGEASLSAIVKDQQQQKENLRRVKAKPLHLTQIEDQAIQELLAFYSAADNKYERITVRRADSGAVAAPTWVSSTR